MSIVFNQITEISDSDGKVLIKYPVNTLLDRITDVWPLIIDYYQNFRPFVFGVHSGSYSNYRLITHEECNTKTFVQLLKTHYKKNKGIRSLITEDEYTRREYLCSDKGTIHVGERKIYANAHGISSKYSYRWHCDNDNGYGCIYIKYLMNEINSKIGITRYPNHYGVEDLEPYGLFVLSHLDFIYFK